MVPQADESDAPTRIQKWKNGPMCVHQATKPREEASMHCHPRRRWHPRLRHCTAEGSPLQGNAKTLRNKGSWIPKRATGMPIPATTRRKHRNAPREIHTRITTEMRFHRVQTSPITSNQVSRASRRPTANPPHQLRLLHAEHHWSPWLASQKHKTGHQLCMVNTRAEHQQPRSNNAVAASRSSLAIPQRHPSTRHCMESSIKHCSLRLHRRQLGRSRTQKESIRMDFHDQWHPDHLGFKSTKMRITEYSTS